MSRSFLGKGWRFPVLPDESGRLSYTDGDENVEQSLKILLLTSLGERAMRFDFGCRASELVFAPVGDRHLRLLESAVQEAVRDWELRVDLLDVQAEIDPSERERAIVSVAYRVRATNTRNNLVFPFYLDSIEIA